MTYKGGCHCGRIAFEVDANIESVYECNCSICTKRGYLLAFVPREQLRLSTPESNLSTYMFNKHNVKHHFCAQCGCGPFGEGTDRKGVATTIVNVRCLEEIDLASLKRTPVDGRSF